MLNKFEHYYIGAIKQQHDAKIQNGGNQNNQLDIQTNMISGIKLKLLRAKKNEYGEHNLFQVLDEKQLHDIYKLAEECLKIQIWNYNDKCYLRVNKRKSRSICYRPI